MWVWYRGERASLLPPWKAGAQELSIWTSMRASLLVRTWNKHLWEAVRSARACLLLPDVMWGSLLFDDSIHSYKLVSVAEKQAEKRGREDGMRGDKADIVAASHLLQRALSASQGLRSPLGSVYGIGPFTFTSSKSSLSFGRNVSFQWKGFRKDHFTDHLDREITVNIWFVSVRKRKTY